MPDELLAYIQGVKADRAMQSVRNFARTAIVKLEAALSLEEPLEKGVYDWSAWRASRQGFPLFMDSSQEVLRISKLCKRPTADKVWKKFMDFMDDHPNRGAHGLIVKALGNGFWVIHNKWELPHAAGMLRIRVAAASEGMGICMEPLPSLAAAVKLVWRP